MKRSRLERPEYTLYKGENIWFGNHLLWREKGSLWPDFNLDFSGETQQRGFLETAPGNDRGIEKERDRETERQSWL